MDAFLDTAWEFIATTFVFLGDSFFGFLEHFHSFGPVIVIGLLALFTVMVTKSLNRILVTRRYLELEKEYQYWFNLRQETMKFQDTEKGKRMARNIDQAQLNKAYYDYFFEGFLLNVVRKVMPILFMYGFINEYYNTDAMVAAFGRAFMFSIPTSGGDPLLVGAAFWYIICLLGCYIGWPLVKLVVRRLRVNTGIIGSRIDGGKAAEEMP